METTNSLEEIENHEDPIVMYLVVRESLGMGVGKTAAQCAHATQILTLNYIRELADDAESILDGTNTIGLNSELLIFKNWLNSSFRKVVLRADDKEWEKLKQLPNHVLVVDSGKTEIAPGSETCIGFWPMLKSERPKLLTRLQALK